ncbi:MAG: hypothetical protein K1W18_11535 [Oscillospiraceae bacterium]
MRILIACEESQTVCRAMRERGHEAYSADIQEPSGGHHEWHILGDVLPIINGNCEFTTMDGIAHEIDGKWDLLIAHPPCTYLTVSGNRWFNVNKYGEKALQRIRKRNVAVEFFMKFVNADCDKIAVENPVGYMNSHYRKADQIIQPYEYGHKVSKKTCLWLKNLPKLQPTNIVAPDKKYSSGKAYSGAALYATDETGKIIRWNNPLTAKIRSKTFRGIAEAIADQWTR